MSLRWVVRPGDGATLGAVVARAGGDPLAIAEGRVFVGRRRVERADEPARVDDELTIARPRGPASGLEILYRDADLVAANKPAGMPSIPDASGASHSLLYAAARAVGLEPARLHPTSRLDREVSGVVVFAVSSWAKERLRDARARGEYARRYVAIAAGGSLRGAEDRAVWDAPIGRADDPRRRRVSGRDAVPARTRVFVAARVDGFALLAVAPETGRTHQIRVHAAHAGAPLFGDRTYGGPTTVSLPGGRVLALDRIALHAARVEIPARRGALVLDAAVPDELAELWSKLGGAPDAWPVALASPV